MAVQSSFKQQCPSCEAMVPIRDPGLIGRKIDCPKCKYRFVVEEPAAEEADDKDDKGKAGITNKKPAGKAAPKRRGDDEEDDLGGKPQAKKGGGSGMLIVGLGLAAVAVVALAVGGWLLFGGDSDTPSDSPGTRANVAPPSKSGETKQDKAADAGQPKAAIKPHLQDASNLLPNETEIVLNLPAEQLLANSAFKKAILQTPGSFNPACSVTSAKVPSPLFRNSRTRPYSVTSTSGKPSLFTSPTATPIPNPATSSPEPALTSLKRPSGICWYK